MPKIKRTATTERFDSLMVTSRSVGEHNDCSVKAIAIATDTDYDVVLKLATKFGRKPGRGTPFSVSARVIEELGFKIRKWTITERVAKIHSYPTAHRGLSAITTHHPRRFPKAWANCHPNMIWSTDHHMLAVKDGVVQDWSVNRALRINYIWEIEKAPVWENGGWKK